MHHNARSSGCINMQGVQSRREFGFQRIVYGPVFRQPREPGKGRSTDFHSIVRLAPRGCASMTVVQMRLVHYIEFRRRKNGGQRGTNALRTCCQFLRH